MEEIILYVEPREELGRGKVKDLRGKGFIPGVVYAGGKESQVIKVPRREFLHLLHEYHIENAVINLKMKDDIKQKARACLIKEIQYDPVIGDVIHLDFNEISLTKNIKVSVPVSAKGEPVGVKQEGGSLEHILWEIEVECLPTQIPKEIAVDVTPLKIGDSIHIKDITVPAGVKILNDPNAIILSVGAPMKEEVAAAPVEGEEAKEPEVIREKKEIPAEAEGAEKKEEKKEKEKEK